MIECRIDGAWRVRARGVIEAPLSASAVWGQMRDVQRFLTLDPLHVRVTPVGAVGERGADWAGQELVISHRLLGIGPDRRGRVLRWREGRGYAISDLSRRGNRRGFPHICTYEVESAGPGRCRLMIGARGVWTARWLPRWAARMWIWWVLMATEACVRRELLAYARWRRARRTSPRSLGGRLVRPIASLSALTHASRWGGFPKARPAARGAGAAPVASHKRRRPAAVEACVEEKSAHHHSSGPGADHAAGAVLHEDHRAEAV